MNENTVASEVQTAYPVTFCRLPVRSTDIHQPLVQEVFISPRIANDKIIDICDISLLKKQMTNASVQYARYNETN